MPWKPFFSTKSISLSYRQGAVSKHRRQRQRRWQNEEASGLALRALLDMNSALPAAYAERPKRGNAEACNELPPQHVSP